MSSGELHEHPHTGPQLSEVVRSFLLCSFSRHSCIGYVIESRMLGLVHSTCVLCQRLKTLDGKFILLLDSSALIWYSFVKVITCRLTVIVSCLQFSLPGRGDCDNVALRACITSSFISFLQLPTIHIA